MTGAARIAQVWLVKRTHGCPEVDRVYRKRAEAEAYASSLQNAEVIGSLGLIHRDLVLAPLDFQHLYNPARSKARRRSR